MAPSSRLRSAGSVVAGLMLSCAVYVNSVGNISMSGSSVTPATSFSTTPNRNQDNLSFESSCVPLNWTLAERGCGVRGTELFTLVDVATSVGGHALKRAQAEHGTIWINRDVNGTCHVADGESKTFNKTSCRGQHHYLCTSTTTGGSSDWYIPCPNDSPDKGTTASCPPAFKGITPAFVVAVMSAIVLS